MGRPGCWRTRPRRTPLARRRTAPFGLRVLGMGRRPSLSPPTSLDLPGRSGRDSFSPCVGEIRSPHGDVMDVRRRSRRRAVRGCGCGRCRGYNRRGGSGRAFIASRSAPSAFVLLPLGAGCRLRSESRWAYSPRSTRAAPPRVASSTTGPRTRSLHSMPHRHAIHAGGDVVASIHSARCIAALTPTTSSTSGRSRSRASLRRRGTSPGTPRTRGSATARVARRMPRPPHGTCDARAECSTGSGGAPDGREAVNAFQVRPEPLPASAYDY
jgi:hypothetical protein